MATKNLQSLGELLRDSRKRAGLGLRQAAREADVPKSSLESLENDRIGKPELGKLLRLAAVLELDPIRVCEAAGYDISSALPTIQPYLRSKYPNLPPSAQREIAAIAKKYGVDGTRPGPAPGEDEN